MAGPIVPRPRLSTLNSLGSLRGVQRSTFSVEDARIVRIVAPQPLAKPGFVRAAIARRQVQRGI